MKLDLLFSSFPFITSEKVTLTQITDLEFEDLWEIMGDDENYRFSPTGALRSKEDAKRKLRQIGLLFRDRRMIVLGIYSDLNRLLGIFEISGINPDVNQVSINFTLRQDAVGFGYASAAVRAASKYLMETIEVNRIQAFVLPINYRAILVLERCGFVKEGTIREGFRWPDKGIVDLSLYALLPSDYRRAKSPVPKKPETNYYL